jgi:O-6-methylguanine DNA methyltransferase
MFTGRINTSHGLFQAWYSDRGLARLGFPGKKIPSAPRARPVSSGPAPIRRWHRLTNAALDRILRGQPAAKLPPLDLSAATPFQQRVWSALRRINSGQTCSYSELARRVGHPGAARAVGNACRANPVPLFIPCHRVLAQGGNLGGFSGGLNWKRLLLRPESVCLRQTGSTGSLE